MRALLGALLVGWLVHASVALGVTPPDPASVLDALEAARREARAAVDAAYVPGHAARLEAALRTEWPEALAVDGPLPGCPAFDEGVLGEGRSLSLEPLDAAGAWWMLGLEAALKGGMDVHRLAVDEAAVRAPSCADLLGEAGFAELIAERHARAILLLRAAVSLDPTLEPAWVNLGNALLRVGDGQGALEVLTEALELDPGDRLAAGLLVRALQALGLGGEASALDEALELLGEETGPPAPPAGTPQGALDAGLSLLGADRDALPGQADPWALPTRPPAGGATGSGSSPRPPSARPPPLASNPMVISEAEAMEAFCKWARDGMQIGLRLHGELQSSAEQFAASDASPGVRVAGSRGLRLLSGLGSGYAARYLELYDEKGCDDRDGRWEKAVHGALSTMPGDVASLLKPLERRGPPEGMSVVWSFAIGPVSLSEDASGKYTVSLSVGFLSASLAVRPTKANFDVAVKLVAGPNASFGVGPLGVSVRAGVLIEGSIQGGLQVGVQYGMSPRFGSPRQRGWGSPPSGMGLQPTPPARPGTAVTVGPSQTLSWKVQLKAGYPVR